MEQNPTDLFIEESTKPLTSHRNTTPFNVAFQDLSVHVPAVSSCLPCCTFRNIKAFGAEYFGTSLTERGAFSTLDRVSGCIKSGETLLVLGPSGSGKSTLLRALCGRLNSTDELQGTITLNGMPIGKSNQRWRRLCSYVSADDGTHSPVLTVGETFRFAAQCTSDGKTNDATLETRVDWILQALGLSHVKNTVVGDENLRGVSGGQKRRVTVGEMLLNPHSRVFCLDNITDGLASTDSYSLLEQISQASKKNALAAVVTLLQPSDEIVGLFDKLLVLSNEGQPAYFGPVNREKLRKVFIGDADPNEADAGSIADLVLSIKDANNKTEPFLESEMHRDLIKKIGDVQSAAPAVEDREASLEALLPNTKYSTSGWYQLQIITNRRLKLILRNTMTYARVVIAIVFGLVVGSLFSALNNDTIGALGKTGYIFLSSFLVLMLSAAVTIPDGFRQRITLFKHRNAGFYSGRIAYLVQWALDMPLSVIEATIIASISYFWIGMTPGSNHFFLFLFALIGLECVGQAFARVLCAVSRTQVSANVSSSLFILLFATVGGFMPTYDSITWVLRWLSWITPVAYAFEAMMINQFEGESFYGIVIVNQDVGSTSIGTVEGTKYLEAQSLPRASWTTNQGIMAFDILMLFVFAFILDIIGLHYQEKTRGWFFNQIRRPRAKVSGNVSSADDPEAQSSGVSFEQEHAIESLSVKNLCYTVKTKSGSLTLLNDVSARFTRGRMTALMGQSGAGKTTLLDVIAGYKTGGKISGDILIDGQPKLESTWKHISGYAEQQDLLNPYMSVRETIEFTANCRLPGNVDRQAAINDVMTLMGLGNYANMIIGREKEGEGLPKHARKRLTIAVQLVTKPKILFLDEPTSGLGATAAALVMKAVRRSTDALGLITLVTIHQPSRKMFEGFDNLLLLAKGGRACYCAEIGQKSQTLLKYFANLSGETSMDININPADFVLNVLDNGSPDDAVASFQQSTLSKDIYSAIDADINGAEGKTPLRIEGHKNSFFSELVLLVKRQFLVQWRNPAYSLMRVTVSASACFLLGLLFFNVKKDIQGAVFAIAAIFFMVFVLVIPMQSAVIPLIEDRSVLYREAVSGTYSRLSYGLGQLIADIPFHAVNTIIMYSIIYYMVGFRAEAEYVGYFIIMLFLANWCVMSLGQLYALVTPNEETANGLAGLSVILSVCLMGFLITSSAMPEYWTWAYQANLFRYILQGLVTNELSGQTYHINIGELIPEINMTSTVFTNQHMLDTVNVNNNDFKAINFLHGEVPDGDNYSAQAARLVGLALNVKGENVDTPKSREDLKCLMSCLVQNDCLVEPVATNFIQCTADYSSVCAFELSELIGNQEDGENIVSKCFGSDTIDFNTVLAMNTHQEVASCMMRKLLPFKGASGIIQGFNELGKVVMAIQDIIADGLDIPGDAILFYFGWSQFNVGESAFEAPWKWHYCVTAVGLFLVGMEMIKVFAVQFIVWTKR